MKCEHITIIGGYTRKGCDRDAKFQAENLGYRIKVCQYHIRPWRKVTQATITRLP